MILSDTAIRRPVFTTMVISAIVLFGLVSLRELGVDLFPRVEMPTITIVSVLPGADPETMESSVTDLIEEAVATISAIKHLRSTSSDSVSQVVIEFELSKDVDVAYQEVQAKLGTIRSELPDDLEDPVVEKFDVDAMPILAVVVSADLEIGELTHLADKTVKERIQRVPHVGQVRLVGARDRKIWLWLDRDRLEGHGLSAADVERALLREHIEYPGGRVESDALEYIVKTKAEFSTAAQFERMVVAYRGGAPVRMADIGRVEDGVEEERSLARLDERKAVALLVRRQSGTNTVEVARQVKETVAALRSELAPRGVKLEIAKDMSVFIEQSLEEVRFHLLVGGALAVLIVLLFLRSGRSTLINALVLPTSIIGTFIAMNVLGFTQNMMTLLALSLAIGLLIDDAIVVQENIMRHLEHGRKPYDAASFGTGEIALAVLATTLSAVGVFIPVAFMKGIIGRFFFQFGISVAFAVLVSMFVSFTLTPMLSARLLREPRRGWLYRLGERILGGVDRVYEVLLGVALRHRWVVILLALASFAGAGYLVTRLRSEFLPAEDQSEFNVKVKAPLGSPLAVTDALMASIRTRLAGRPWLEYTFTTIGADELRRVNEGVLYVKMRPKEQRSTSQLEAMAWLRRQVAELPAAAVSVEIVPRISGGGRKWADVQMELRGPDLERLDEMARQVIARMRGSRGYVDIDTSYEKGKPEVDVLLDRDRIADLGVGPLQVARAVKALIGGDDVAKFKAGGDRYDIGVRLEEPYRSEPRAIEELSVRTGGGALVKLGNLSRVRVRSGPVQIDRYNRTRQITILANLEQEHKVLGEAIEEMRGFAGEIGLEPGYSVGFTGMADVMQESFGYLLFALALAVGIIYMILAAQFESFVHPLTIMLSVPLAVIGAVGALVAAEMTMSIYTMIGIILLMGLVTKNGILLVDYINILRRRDAMGRDEAVAKAGPTRLRPILMTTFAMIFGMAPIALGSGAGSESRAPMAVAVIGGLVTSTLLTLVVVPVVYTLLDDLAHPRSWRISGMWRWMRRNLP